MEHNECQKTKPSQGGSVYPSVGALAEELNISRQSAYDALQRGEIPAIRIGKRWLLPKAAIAAWLGNAGRDRKIA